MSAKITRERTGAPKLRPGLVATSDYGPRLAPFDQKTLALWAADCAEHVLSNFEKLRPRDDRPRNAIDAARAWAHGKIDMMTARAAAVKAHAAARASGHPAAVAAARAAGHAAATAHSIRHARGAPAYAIVSVIASTTPDKYDLATSAELDWQLSKLPRTKPLTRPTNGSLSKANSASNESNPGSA
jgi:hypothetical protein